MIRHLRPLVAIGASSLVGCVAAFDRSPYETKSWNYNFPFAIAGNAAINKEVKRGSHTYPANSPIEDRMISGQHKNGWTFGAVFDGHGGWQVSEAASQKLMDLIFENFPEDAIDISKSHIVDNHIVQAYQRMEDMIVEAMKEAFHMGFSDVAKVGTCSLLALKKDSKLIVINNGDCRAVLGSLVNNTIETATVINRDHNCRVPYEQVELNRLHPNEDNIVLCKSSRACYVKGRLQLTRSLGDAYLKYPDFNGSPDKGRAGGRYIPPPYTPPYVSHHPDVHHVSLDNEDRFLILGTDGLWDDLSEDEAVQIVFRGLREKRSPDDIAKILVQRALTNAAKESGLTFDELLQLPIGRARRNRHDDTTAVVLVW